MTKVLGGAKIKGGSSSSSSSSSYSSSSSSSSDECGERGKKKKKGSVGKAKAKKEAKGGKKRRKKVELLQAQLDRKVRRLEARSARGGEVDINVGGAASTDSKLGIMVCNGKKCRERGAEEITKRLERMGKLDPNFVVSMCKCMGRCKKAPNVKAYDLGSA